MQQGHIRLSRTDSDYVATGYWGTVKVVEVRRNRATGDIRIGHEEVELPLELRHDSQDYLDVVLRAVTQVRRITE